MLNDRNITIDPQSPATPVDSPEIGEVLDLTTGLFHDVKDFIGSRRYDAFVNERVRIREALSRAPLFACALCATPVYVVASPEKKFFFRHCVEDGSCPAQTRGSLSQVEILERKYHGLRESEAHKKIKSFIERSLTADASFAPETVLQEKRWRSSADPKAWRQPDVQARRDEQRFAFEVQLSTTFLNVVVERRNFYREERANLVWIFGHFTPEYRRMTTDDLLFSNNANILVVDEETTRRSEETRSFHMRCHYLASQREGEAVKEVWQEALIPFSDLKCDVENQQAYFFDCAGERARLEKELDAELRQQMFAFWEDANPHFGAEAEMRWEALKSRFAPRGIVLPEGPSADGGFRGMMFALLSATRGAPVGWQFNSLIEVAHRVAEGYPEHLLRFGFALEVSGHRDLLDLQDGSGRWKRKRMQVSERIKAGDLTYFPDPQWQEAFEFLFPVVAEKVSAFIGRHWPMPVSAQ